MHSDDVNLKGIAGFLGLLALTLVIVYGALTAMWRHLEAKARQADQQTLRQSAPAAAASTRPYFPLPREQPVPIIDLQTLQARERAELNSYGWIDKSAGVVRIPIDRAIELMTQTPKQQP
jgi:hypothetical protein